MKVRDILESYLKERGLELAEDKTNIVHTHEGFDFLGFDCRLYNTSRGYKCFIKPSNDSVKKAKSKISDIFEVSKGGNVDTLIDRLNPVIRDIGYFWRTAVSKEIYSKMDHYIWEKSFRFLKRLHPKKSSKWIYEKYFPYYDDGYHKSKWMLTGPNNEHTIFKMSHIPIKRWKMIKHNYSPYDASKKEYFEERAKNYLI